MKLAILPTSKYKEVGILIVGSGCLQMGDMKEPLENRRG